jgi:hypothetical protein
MCKGKKDGEATSSGLGCCGIVADSQERMRSELPEKGGNGESPLNPERLVKLLTVQLVAV